MVWRTLAPTSLWVRLAFSLPSDQFGDINEMILDAMTAVKTGRLGLFDDLLEIAIIRVSQNL
jgi:hypothetical protein